MEGGEGGSRGGTADGRSEKVDFCGRQSAKADGVCRRLNLLPGVSRRLEMRPAASEKKNFRLRRQSLVFSLIWEPIYFYKNANGKRPRCLS